MLTGKKTVIVSLLITIFGALESFDFTQLLGGDIAGYVVTGIGIIMFVLRALTTTPILKNE